MLFKKNESVPRGNKFLNVVTVITVALSVLVVSVFMMFYTNAQNIVASWQQGVRIQVYMENGLDEAKTNEAKVLLGELPNVVSATFISKQDAFQELKSQLHRQEGMLEGIPQNPLPDSFELQVNPEVRDVAEIERVAKQAERISGVTNVEYGKEWVNRFVQIFSAFRLISIAMAILFLFAAIFIVSNTIRLALYSRYDEVEIMRLVGVPNNYIKKPFYMEGMLLGGIGGALGLLILLGFYALLSFQAGEGLMASAIQIRFLPWWMTVSIFIGSILVGILGSHLSIQHFFKETER